MPPETQRLRAEFEDAKKILHDILTSEVYLKLLASPSDFCEYAVFLSYAYSYLDQFDTPDDAAAAADDPDENIKKLSIMGINHFYAFQKLINEEDCEPDKPDVTRQEFLTLFGEKIKSVETEFEKIEEEFDLKTTKPKDIPS